MAPKGWFNLDSTTSLPNISNALPEGIRPDQPTAFDFLGLTRTQRLYAFVACLAIGFVLSLLGSILLFLGAFSVFAILYTVGIIVSLAGTGFLIGFFRQMKMMFAPVRVVATAVFLISIALVFIGAFVLDSELMCIILVVVEYLAYTWYCLSYIPYSRGLIKTYLGF